MRCIVSTFIADVSVTLTVVMWGVDCAMGEVTVTRKQWLNGINEWTIRYRHTCEHL